MVTEEKFYLDMNLMFTSYRVKKMTKSDVSDIYTLCKSNPIYYKYCPPFVTKRSIKKDLVILPPNTTAEDKYYLGIYSSDVLICVLDLILHYPQKDTAFIGFFMLDKEYQGQGIGSELFEELSSFLASHSFNKIRLGYVKGNQQSEKFWKKQGFQPVGLEVKQDSYTIVVLEKNIGKLI